VRRSASTASRSQRSNAPVLEAKNTFFSGQVLSCYVLYLCSLNHGINDSADLVFSEADSLFLGVPAEVAFSSVVGVSSVSI
jgi:hypothetical protein